MCRARRLVGGHAEEFLVPVEYLVQEISLFRAWVRRWLGLFGAGGGAGILLEVEVDFWFDDCAGRHGICPFLLGERLEVVRGLEPQNIYKGTELGSLIQ